MNPNPRSGVLGRSGVLLERQAAHVRPPFSPERGLIQSMLKALKRLGDARPARVDARVYYEVFARRAKQLGLEEAAR